MLKFFLLQNPKAGGKYMPNTKHSGKYSLKGFLEYVSKRNRDIPINTFRDVFQAMTDSVKEILSDGSTITIPGFIRISAAVKGEFGSYDESFDKKKHGIGINCTVLPDFTAKVGDGIKIKKIPVPGRYPLIERVFEYETKRNALHRDYANRISGNYFRQKCYRFTGMDIICISGMEKTLHLEKDDINIIKQGGKEILFTFKRNFAFPDWLANETGIFISLIFKNKAGFKLPFRAYKTVWLC